MHLQITKPLAGQMFYIDESGQMPMLRMEAVLLDEDEQPLKAPMQWLLQVSENIWPGACPSAKIGRQTVRMQGVSAGLGMWNPLFATPCGGDAQLSVSAQWEGQTYDASIGFRIRGRNPSSDAVIQRMGGERSPLTLLSRHLTALRQFDHQGMPFLGERGQVGILQLCDPPAQPLQRWSWVHNIDAAKVLLQRLQGKSRAYLDQHRGNSDENRYTNDADLDDDGVLLREMLQRFLGASYWQWDEAEQRWCRNPPDETVEALLQSAGAGGNRGDDG